MIDNKVILNSIRQTSSQDYQNRIPVATDTNLEQVGILIETYPTAKNEFITTLTNQVAKTVFLAKLYNNPFKFFKKGNLPYGKTIEQIFVDIIKGKAFGENFGSSGVESLVSKEVQDNVHVEYISENYRNKYKISISDQQLKGAFRDENGLSSLVQRLVQAPLNSAEFDEFLMIKKVLSKLKISELEITDFATLDENAQAKKLTKTVKTMVNKMRFMSKNYNAQGVYTFTKPEDIVILVTPETQANIDVELLASSFHMDKAEIEGRIVLIDEFLTDSDGTESVDTDCLALICDKDLVQFWETENTTETFRNADKLETNLFYHRWGIISGCNFANAIKIKNKTGV